MVDSYLLNTIKYILKWWLDAACYLFTIIGIVSTIMLLFFRKGT